MGVAGLGGLSSPARISEVIFNCPVMVSPVLETTFNVDRAADALFAPVPPNDVDTLVVI